jgi:1-acyl-sn-glycerol-3-phosphate acyltransferase
MLAKICKYLPVSLVNYISNIIINKLLNKYANINVDGYDNLKDAPRPIIFICNHLSNADGLVLNKVLFKEDVTFVAGV